MLPLTVSGFDVGDYVRIECLDEYGRTLVVYGTVKKVRSNRIVLEDYERIDVHVDAIIKIEVATP